MGVIQRCSSIRVQEGPAGVLQPDGRGRTLRAKINPSTNQVNVKQETGSVRCEEEGGLLHCDITNSKTVSFTKIKASFFQMLN